MPCDTDFRLNILRSAAHNAGKQIDILSMISDTDFEYLKIVSFLNRLK
jgi:hypothetical protein